MPTLLLLTDKDTAPKSRRETPDFYGFVPPTGRGLVFFLMVVNSTSQFLAKIMSIALLGAVSRTFVVAYLLGDIGLFLLYTIVRNDFFWFVPVQSFAGSLALSFIIRAGEKVRFMRSGVKGELKKLPLFFSHSSLTWDPTNHLK